MGRSKVRMAGCGRREGKPKFYLVNKVDNDLTIRTRVVKNSDILTVPPHGSSLLSQSF